MAITVQQLFKQIQQQDFAAVKRAFGLNPSLVHSKHPKDAHTPLHAAAALGNVQLLKELLQLGASCHEMDCNNEAPLHVAARQGHTATVKELLTDAGRRSCLKAANRDGATPLHLAVLAGHADVVRALVNAGARTDMRDRAGHTPADLVNPTDTELGDILSQGRQLTPSNGTRSVRRTISPALSPPSGRRSRSSSRGICSRPVSPTDEVTDAQRQAGDPKCRGSSVTGINASSKQPSSSSPLSPSRAAGKAAAQMANVLTPPAAAAADAALQLSSNGVQAEYDLYRHPDRDESYDQHGQMLPKPEITPAAETAQQQQQQEEQQQQVQPAPTNQAWLHYSPQKSLDGVFAQVQRQSEHAKKEQQLTPYYEAYQQPPQRTRGPENAEPETGHHKLQHSDGISAAPSAGQHNVAPGVMGTPAASDSTVGTGALGLQYQQRQQQVQQQPAQLGPLHRARAAGTMSAGAAAAAAVNDLTRSFDHHPAPLPSATPAMHNSRQLPQQLSGMSSMKHQPSSLGAAASYIVSPETSSGLLQSQVHHPPGAHLCSNMPHAQASSTSVQSQCPAHSFSQHTVEHSGPLSAGASIMHGQCSRRSLSVIPGSGPNTPRQPGSHSLPPAPPNLAALAAAVAANSRVGPLSQPLQLQLNDLAGKVSQLEAWFEAQVELIPEWQKVLAVVQGLKRQLEEQGDKLNSQQLTAVNWAAQVTAVEKAQHAQADTLASVPRQAMEIAELRAEQAAIKASIAEFGQQISQLQAQLLHQAATEAARNAADECQLRSLQAVLSANAARLATIEESQLASLTTGLTANSSRLATLEAGMDDIRARLREQHSTAKEATAAAASACAESASRANSTPNSKASSPEPADMDTAAADARLLALESSLADLQVTVAELHNANVAAAQQEQRAMEPANTAKPNDAPATVEDGDDAPVGRCSHPSTMELEAELTELKARVADLSASMYCMGSMTPLQGGAVEDTFLPFMETTSNCLQQHEQQLDAIQTLVPKLESVVAQRAQMCELMQQVAALQTAFTLLTGAKPAGAKDTPTRPSPGMLASGPLAANKAAADYLAMATNMVKLQTQMGVLSAAVEQLQQDWDSTSATLKTEHEAIRSAWESERSRLAAAEREAVRRVADQQRELKQREERLTQIREAALAEEAARRSQLDSEERVSAALEGITCQHEQFKGQLAGLADATEALREHLASLQAEVVSSLVNLGPHIAAMAEQEKGQAPAADDDAAVPSLAQCDINVMSSLDNTNPVHEPEAEGTPRATAGLSGAANPFAFSPTRSAVASPKQAGGNATGSQRTRPYAATWQQQQQQTGDIRTSTALAYAEVTGGVCTVNLLPVPPADTAPSGSVSPLPTAVTSTPPPAAAAASAKKGSWLARHLGSYKSHNGAGHRYEQQRDDADVALQDQVAAEAEQEGAAQDSDAPDGPGSSGRALDQSPVKSAAVSSKQAGKWKKPWKKLGFGHKTSSSGTAQP